MTQHAAAAPSSAAMWLNCPASITRAEGKVRPSSSYAREGTAAHKIAEMVIGGDLFPPGKITVEGQEFIVGIPMLRALNSYITVVEGLQALCPEVYVEQRVGIEWSKGHVWGTTDCAAADDKFLHIVDLKYGKGVPVHPDSAQLKIYALGAWHTLWPGRAFKKVTLTVCQPRIDPLPQTHIMSGRDLVTWSDRELLPAVDRILRNDGTEKAGSWCRWCVRRDECAAFRTQKNAAAADAFDDGEV